MKAEDIDKQIEDIIGEKLELLYSGHVEEYRQIAKAFLELGIKEVIDWIEKNSATAYVYEGEYEYFTKCDNELIMDLGDWQAKLKEWDA